MFGFGEEETMQTPAFFAQRGKPKKDLLFNRGETRGFITPAFQAISDIVGRAGNTLDSRQSFQGLGGTLTDRQFAPSKNEQNLIRETIDQINSNQAVLTGGAPTSGTIGRAIGGQLAALDQQDIVNQLQNAALMEQSQQSQQAQANSLLQLAMNAALGLGQLTDPSKILRLGNTVNTKQRGFEVGGQTSGSFGGPGL